MSNEERNGLLEGFGFFSLNSEFKNDWIDTLNKDELWDLQIAIEKLRMNERNLSLFKKTYDYVTAKIGYPCHNWSF